MKIQPVELEIFSQKSGLEEPEVLTPDQEKILQMKDIAQKIVKLIANNYFNLAEKGKYIEIPAGILDDTDRTYAKKVTTNAADIFNECLSYLKNNSFNPQKFENFLAVEIKKLESNTEPVDSFWKKRSNETALIHKNLLSLMDSQYRTLIYLKTVPVKEEKLKQEVNKKLSVKDIERESLQSIFEILNKTSEPTLMTIRFFAKEVLIGNYKFEKFDQQVTDIIKRTQTSSMSTFKPCQKKYHEILDILKTAKEQIVKKQAKSLGFES